METTLNARRQYYIINVNRTTTM